MLLIFFRFSFSFHFLFLDFAACFTLSLLRFDDAVIFAFAMLLMLPTLHTPISR